MCISFCHSCGDIEGLHYRSHSSHKEVKATEQTSFPHSGVDDCERVEGDSSVNGDAREVVRNR